MLMFCIMLISNVAYADEPMVITDMPEGQMGSGGGSSEDKGEDKDEGKESGDGLKSQDGKERKAEDIFVDSGAPSSFKDAKYYDTCIPYNLTYDEVGGYAIDPSYAYGNYGGVHVMSADVIKSKLGGVVAHMGVPGHMIPSDRASNFDNSKVKYSDEEGTGARVVTDQNGVQYYSIAVQGIHLNASSSFFGGGGEIIGQALDIILTDGTVIHCVIGEKNSDHHTNGTTNGKPSDTADGYLTPSKLKMDQYRNLFQACNGAQIELMYGDTEAFKAKYNIGTGEGQNRNMYYRMYDFRIDNPKKPASDDVKALSYKIPVDGKLADGGTDNDDKEITDLEQTGLFEETYFVKWKSGKEEDYHSFADIQNMNNSDIYDVENWKADLEKKNSESFLIKGGRWLTMLFGIIFEVWMLFIYLAYWFDRLNNFFEYRLLELITFGRLTISPDEDSCTFSLSTLGKGEKRTVNHKKVLEVVIIGLAFGTLIISGTFFRILSAVVNKILEILY